MIKCELDLCVYQKDGQCTLPVIQVNIFGYCDSCVLIEIPKEVLDKIQAD